MFGVLLNVSGSMRSAYALDQSRRANVERTHAIFTSIMSNKKIVIGKIAYLLWPLEWKTCPKASVLK